MNLSARTLDWNHVRAFLATAETGSLSAAARRLGLTQPTLSRQVAAFEQALGVLLFERVGRRLELTQGGRELLEHTREMGQAADRVALAATGQVKEITGQIRITASDVFSAFMLPPVLRQLRIAAPALLIDIVATNDIRDIMRREADIAIRHVRPEQPDLIARLVRQMSASFYAAPEYLDKHGRPESLRDLGRLGFVSMGDVDVMLDYLNRAGISVSADNFHIGSDNGIVSWELVRQGFGVAVMSDDVAALTPGVERLLPDMEPFEFPVWLTTHRELHTSPRIRLVFDMLADALARST